MNDCDKLLLHAKRTEATLEESVRLHQRLIVKILSGAELDASDNVTIAIATRNTGTLCPKEKNDQTT